MPTSVAPSTSLQLFIIEDTNLFPSGITPPVPLWFVVTDPASEPIDLVCEYNFNGQGYKTASPSAASDSLQGLGAPFVGADYRFLWDAATDLGPNQSGSVTLRLTPQRGGVAGTAVETASFQVTTQNNLIAPAVAPPVYPPGYPPSIPVTLTALAPTQLEVGISGLVLPDEFSVMVTTPVAGSPTPLGGVEINLTVVPDVGASNPLAEITADVVPITGTPAQGEPGSVFFRVRALPGATGTGTVQARIAGVPDSMPGALSEFQIEVQTPAVAPAVTSLPTSIIYGTDCVQSYAYNLPSGTLALDPRWSIPVVVSGTNLVLSHNAWSPFDEGDGNEIHFTPTVLEGQATLSVAFADPTIPSPPPFAITIQKQQTTTRILDATGATGPVYLMLQQVSGMDGSGNAQVGFPQLTLATPFQVKLCDDQGNSYRVAPVQSWPCGQDPTPVPLTVVFSSTQAAADAAGAPAGSLSTTPGPGTSNTVTVTCAMDANGFSLEHPPVYFTPSGQGPWVITATVNCDLMDATSICVPGIDAAGNPFSTVNAITPVALSAVFYVQAPSQFHLVDMSGNALLANTAQCGYRARFEIDGLSDTIAGTADQIKLETLNNSAWAPRAYVATEVPPDGYMYISYTGIPYGFEQWISFLPRAGGTGPIQSEDFLLTQGDAPVIADPQPTHVQLIVPGALLRIYQADFCVSAKLSVPKPKFDRLLIDGIPALPESPVGTTPRSGARNTVILRSGEFIYSACDLKIASYPPFAFARTYRSQVDSNGPLGPGWMLAHGQYLDTCTQDVIRWYGPSGLFQDFFSLIPPKGVFAQLTTNQTITDDQSAFELADAHQNVFHFNVDGSLKFFIDRKGNRTTYTWNEQGQLIQIQDSLGRGQTASGQPQPSLTLSYWPSGSTPATKIGRLQNITDFAGRTVSYDYDANGRLQVVTYPSVATLAAGLAAGTTATAATRSETYTYTADGQLQSVTIDSQTTPLVFNSYVNSQVSTQTYNGGQFAFTYPDPLTATATDRAGNEVSYTFPASPYADALAPNGYTDEDDNDYDVTCNYDGNIIRLEDPAGVVTSYVYDDDSAIAMGTVSAGTTPVPGAWNTGRELQHGNRLAQRVIATTGDVRTWWYQYDNVSPFGPLVFNFVMWMTGPDANIAGVNPQTLATRFSYDPDTGNVVQVTRPYALHTYMADDGSGDMNWELADPVNTIQYNTYGLPTTWVNPQGIQTDLTYYPQATPTSGTADADNGGFLATCVRDSTQTAARSQYFSDIAPASFTTQWQYDSLGRVQQYTDPANQTATFNFGLLDELNSVTLPSASSLTGSTQPATVQVDFAFNTFGQCTQTRLQQAAATAVAGGPELIRQVATDSAGNITDYYSAVQSGIYAYAVMSLDQNDRPIAWFGPDSAPAPAGTANPVAPPYPDSGFGIPLDARGLPEQLSEGIADGASTTTDPPVVSTLSWTESGQLESLTGAGAAEPFAYVQDEYDMTARLLDPNGNVVSVAFDAAERPQSSIVQIGEDGVNAVARLDVPDFSDAPVLSFEEVFFDELGRMRRRHTGLFMPSSTGAPAPAAANFIAVKQAWASRAPMPTPRHGATCGVIDGLIYVAGGEAAQQSLATLEVYDPARDAWTAGPSMPTPASAVGGVVDGILYVVGGLSAGAPIATLQAFDPRTNSWSAKSPMPTARCNHAVVVDNGTLYAIGGSDSTGANVYATVEAYTPATDSWATLAPLPTARCSLTAALCNGAILAAGGSDGTKLLVTVEFYNPQVNTWTSGTALPAAAIGLASATVGIVFTLGGFQDQAASQAVATNQSFAPSSPKVSTGTWRAQPALPTARGSAAAVVNNSLVFVIGGENGGTDLATNEAFNPAARAWPPVVGPLLPDGAWCPGDGRVTQDVTYDICGLPVRTVDDQVGFVHVRSDPFGRPITITRWSSASDPTQMTEVTPVYDPTNGYLVRVDITEYPTANATIAGAPVQPQSLTYRMDRDELGRVSRVIDGGGNASRVEYDETGFIYLQHNPIGLDSTELYGGTTGPAINLDGDITLLSRNGALQILEMVTPLVSLVDSTGISQVTPALNGSNPAAAVGTSMTYTNENRLETYQGLVPDPSGFPTTFKYDVKGRLQYILFPPSVALPLPAATAAAPNPQPLPSLTISYDLKTGNPLTFTDANGTELTYGYDDVHLRTITVTTLGSGVGGSTLLAFDYEGNVVTATDKTANVVASRTLDSAHRLANEIQGTQTITSSDYQGENRRYLQYPGNGGATHSIGHVYDTAGRLTQVVDTGTGIASFEYIGRLRVVNRILTPVTTTFTYVSGTGWLQSMLTDGLVSLNSIVYTLVQDRLGRTVQRTRQFGGFTDVRSWTYDSAGRIVIETASPALGTSDEYVTTRYYDADTVLCQQALTINGVQQPMLTQTREERGRIITRNGTALVYDKNGNLIKDDSGNTYTYDAWNRLIKATVGGSIITYAYDAFGRLISKTLGGTTESYVYDGWELITVWVGGQMTERYIYGDGLDDLLRVEIGGTPYIVLQTPEGWVEGLVDLSGNVVEAYDYTLSGQVTVLNGAGGVQPAGTRPRSRFLFQRRPFDFDTQLYYYHMRWYSPVLGQLLSPDSQLADQLNQYDPFHGDTVKRPDSFDARQIPLDVPVFNASVMNPAKPPNGRTMADDLLPGVFLGAVCDGVVQSPKTAVAIAGDVWDLTCDLGKAAGGAVKGAVNGVIDFFTPAPVTSAQEFDKSIGEALDLLQKTSDREKVISALMAKGKFSEAAQLRKANVADQLACADATMHATAAGQQLEVDTYLTAAQFYGTARERQALEAAKLEGSIDRTLDAAGHHTLTVERYACEGGKMVRKGRLAFISGFLSEAEKDASKVRNLSALETLEGKLIRPGSVAHYARQASHTERKALRWLFNQGLTYGDTVVMKGSLPPCFYCQHFMKEYWLRTGANVAYIWERNGLTNVWDATLDAPVIFDDLYGRLLGFDSKIAFTSPYIPLRKKFPTK